MAPAHVPPDLAFRVVLVEQVIFALIKHHAVGIVHEVVRRREVILRPPRLVVTVLGERAGQQRTQCNDRRRRGPQHSAKPDRRSSSRTHGWTPSVSLISASTCVTLLR